jgi:succinyl-CoA synthetase alpha subunit
MVAGTDLCEALTVLADDQDTEARILIGEIGGVSEVEAAGWIKEYRARTSNPK